MMKSEKMYFTVLLRFPLYCLKCGTEAKIDLMKFEYKVSAEPDA